jgi:hypothetical protein
MKNAFRIVVIVIGLPLIIAGFIACLVFACLAVGFGLAAEAIQ